MSESQKHTGSREVMDVTACTGFNLRKATRAVTQLYDAALKPSGLKSTQFNLLAALDNLGPLPQSRLAEALVMDRTTLIRNLGPLTREGLVATETTGENRVKTITLTDRGQKIFADALPRWRDAQTRMAETLGYDRWNSLIDGLEASIAATHQS